MQVLHHKIQISEQGIVVEIKQMTTSTLQFEKLKTGTDSLGEKMTSLSFATTGRHSADKKVELRKGKWLTHSENKTQS